MVCEKCGAQYDNTFEKCPYCGEVFKIPGNENKKKQKIYGKNVRKLARTLHITEEFSEKIMKSIPYIAVILLALLCVFGVYKYFSGVGSKEYKDKQKNLKQLENYYNEGNYQKVHEKISGISNPLKSKEYICYYSVGEIYAEGKEYLESDADAKRVLKSNDHELIAENAKKAFTSLAEVYKTWEILTAKYGDIKNNNEYAGEVLKWYAKNAEETYNLSENEVEEIMKEGYSDSTVIDGYVDVVFRRVRATGESYATDEGINIGDEYGETEK